MKYTTLLTAGLLAVSINTYANTPVDTALWTKEAAPARGGATQNWTSVGGNQTVQDNNTNGSLISNFVENGDFTFSGSLTPTTAAFNDNDILGLVFGWQDAQNHYRLGWEQGGWNDISGASGMWLVKEMAGISTVLFETEHFWQDNVSYNFFVGRSGNDISFSLDGIMQTITDTTFMSGKVGFYTESQTAKFSGLASVPTAPSQVPVPAAAMLFVPALLGFMGLRRKANKA